ncbi:MAG: uracil-DNA glycosylase [Kofleriaceae bacterium]
MTLRALSTEITACRRCARLVRCREAIAKDPPKRHAGETYWAKAVPGFGDPAARLLVVGLAPAANGANRTGRVFTGDRSGDWLYAALHRAGYANQPTSSSREDGLVLADAYVACIVRCAPPDNKPTPVERNRCVPYFARELALLANVRAVIALGAFAWDGFLLAAQANGHAVARPTNVAASSNTQEPIARPKNTHKPIARPKFSHGRIERVGPYTLVGSYHVSQQNTFTGRLTEPMLDRVFRSAREAAAEPVPRSA